MLESIANEEKVLKVELLTIRLLIVPETCSWYQVGEFWTAWKKERKMGSFHTAGDTSDTVKTCLKRPPHGARESGRYRQVVS